MSEFKKYAERLNELAKAAFLEYKTAEIDTASRREKLDSMPAKVGMVDADYAAKYARAKADYAEAAANFQKAKQNMANTANSFESIRKELVEAVKKKYAADPEQIDNKTLTLLESGVLTPYDFSNLMEKAIADENHTMQSIIGNYAEKAVEKTAAAYGRNSTQAQVLVAVSNLGKRDPGAERIEAFDVMTSIYGRAVKNPRMIDYWDSLTESTINNF